MLQKGGALSFTHIPHTHVHPFISSFIVTIQVSLLWHRLWRQSGGGRRGHPAPHQGALQAPWNPLLNSYPLSTVIIKEDNAWQQRQLKGKDISQAGLSVVLMLWRPPSDLPGDNP